MNMTKPFLPLKMLFLRSVLALVLHFLKRLAHANGLSNSVSSDLKADGPFCYHEPFEGRIL